MAKTKQEIPRWRRKKTAPARIHLPRRERKRLVREVVKATAQTPGTGTPQAAAVPVPGPHLMRAGFRWRLHAVPFGWGIALTCTGLLLHLLHGFRLALILGAATAVLLPLLCRHLSAFALKWAAAMGLLTAFLLPFLAAFGAQFWLPVTGLAWAWVAKKWIGHYRWRPEEKTEPEVDMSDAAIWARLAAKNRWAGHLKGSPSPADGVRQYRIVLDGAETHMGQVMSEPRRIAAAWGKSIAEAYAEPSPDGVESRGLLTILPRNTLEKAREWDGAGIDPETGLATIGRFPDGAPSRERYFIRNNGVRHTIIAGADGSGKTGMLNLGLSLSATSGIIAPVILDPQEGQALPAWKDQVPYARGVDECMAYLEGLHSALLARSRDLGRYRWTTEDGDERTGLDFFDPYLTGLPIVEITLDEASALFLTEKVGTKALDKMAAIGKLGRKAGFRLRIAIHVPSLAEFGGNAQALRSILAGGNVLCGRTGDKVSSGMIGIAADPSQLPKYFADGSPTVGLGYGSGPDNRPATPQRWDWVPDPYKVARTAQVRALDDRVATALDRAITAGGVQLPLPATAPPLAAVPPATDDEGSEGRTCSDAILAVLDGEMTRGQIMGKVKTLTEGEWGRPKTFSTKAIQNALTAMAGDGRLLKPRDGVYRRALQAVK